MLWRPRLPGSDGSKFSLSRIRWRIVGPNLTFFWEVPGHKVIAVGTSVEGALIGKVSNVSAILTGVGIS